MNSETFELGAAINSNLAYIACSLSGGHDWTARPNDRWECTECGYWRHGIRENAPRDSDFIRLALDQ